MRPTPFLALGALLLFTTAAVHAQSDVERATARDAANTGRAAFDAGQYEKAIDSFSRAESLVHALPHLLFMARAQAKSGKLVAAHETYLKITRETLKPNAPKAFEDAQAAAQQELPALDARLPSVTVTLQGAPATGVTVQMDGTALAPAMVGIPLPADPGQHVFKASGSAVSEPITVTLAEGSKQAIVVQVHATGLPPAAAPTGPAVTAAAPSEAFTADSSRMKGSGLRIASYVSFGVGVVGLAAGTYFLLKSGSTRSDADGLYNQCHAISPVGDCGALRDQLTAKDNDANSQRTLGAAGLVVGGVGAAAGIVFLILDSGSSSKTAQQNGARVIPVVGINTLGVAGTF